MIPFFEGHLLRCTKFFSHCQCSHCWNSHLWRSYRFFLKLVWLALG
jgi:hypothetical protein